MKITRRDALKAASVAAGGLTLERTLGGTPAWAAQPCEKDRCARPFPTSYNQNTYFQSLPIYCPNSEQVGNDEMRITFLGTSCLPALAQEENSVLVELGSGDKFVFDCGSGVAAKYNAMEIPYSSMDKIFLTHLHADHASDLMNIYCFGPANDRKTPLYVWGNSASGLVDPYGNKYDDSVTAFCAALRSYARWHTESFSFLSTGMKPGTYTPPSWAPQNLIDGYDLVPFELDWRKNPGIAYPPGATDYDDPDLDVVIVHFPAVHDREGAMSYKLEWRSRGLSMVFTGDTLPNNYVVDNAKMRYKGKDKGVDVLIHEMVVPPDVWAYINSAVYPPPQFAIDQAETVQQCSHTPQLAYGYILHQLELRGLQPRLAVGTHFQACDATIPNALSDILYWYKGGKPNIHGGNVLVASDLLVLNVTQNGIRRRRGLISDFAYVTPTPPAIEHQGDLAAPKYSDSHAQLDPSADVIPWGTWNKQG